MSAHADPARESAPARDASPARETPRLTAIAAPLALVALLLFCWPFVRVPRLSLGEAWAHLFGAWALLVAMLFVLSRTIARSARRLAPRRREPGA
jgi:hypothetical protein